MGNKKELQQVEVPYWLVEQFKITGGDAGPGEIPHGLKYDKSVGFDVGTFDTKTHGPVGVEFEASSGQHNWWTAINVWDRKGSLISQSDASTDLLGPQEYHLEDGTVIEFAVVQEPGPRDWSPRGKAGMGSLGDKGAPMSLTKAYYAVLKATGYALSEEEIGDLLEEYKGLSTGELKKKLQGLVKGERGGDTPEKTAKADDILIVLAARPEVKMSGPTMGLDTAEERQHARTMALRRVAHAREGSALDRAEARGYLMAIRDLAVDEGAEELAIEMARLLEEMK